METPFPVISSENDETRHTRLCGAESAVNAA